MSMSIVRSFRCDDLVQLSCGVAALMLHAKERGADAADVEIVGAIGGPEGLSADGVVLQLRRHSVGTRGHVVFDVCIVNGRDA